LLHFDIAAVPSGCVVIDLYGNSFSSASLFSSNNIARAHRALTYRGGIDAEVDSHWRARRNSNEVLFNGYDAAGNREPAPSADGKTAGISGEPTP
jgi:hypothetical protein